MQNTLVMMLLTLKDREEKETITNKVELINFYFLL